MKEKLFKMNLQLFSSTIPSLKELLGEELYNQVTEKVGEHKLDIVSSGNWIPKEKFDQVNGDKKTYKEQVEKLNKDLGDLQKQLKDNEGATKTIEDLQKTITDNEKKMAELQKNAAIKLALKDAKAKDADVLFMLVDKEKIEIAEDGTTKGLEDQLKGLKESKSYLFEEVTPPGMGGSPGNQKRQQETQQNTSSTDDFMKAILENQAQRN